MHSAFVIDAVHSQRHPVVIDRVVNVAAQSQENRGGSPATTSEVINNDLGEQLINNVWVQDHANFWRFLFGLPPALR
jgi:hypothetical protein